MAAKARSSSEMLALLDELFHPIGAQDPENPKEPAYVYHDVDYLRGLLEDSRLLITKVLQESADLVEASERFKNEAFEIQDAQAKEIQEKRLRVEELEALCIQKDEALEKQRADAAQELFDACQKLKIVNRRLHDTMGKRLEELQALLTGVMDFRDRQVEVEGRMAAAEEYAAKTKAEMDKIIPDLERNYLEKCSQHEKEFEKKLKELKVQLTAEVEERVGERMRNILANVVTTSGVVHNERAQNEQLIEDIRIHVGATSGLTKRKDELQEEASTLATEVGLLQSAEALHLRRGSNQHRMVENHACKVAMLEKSLRQVIRQYSCERSQLETTHRQVVSELSAEKQALKNLVLGKTKELKKLRHLAQHVVTQRGEVENFLIESLEYVKQQLAASRRSGGAVGRDTDEKRKREDHGDYGSCDSSTHLPSIKSTPRSWPGAASTKSYQRPTKSSRGFITTLKSKFHQHDDFLKQLHEVDAPGQEELREDFKNDAPKITPKVDISDLSWCDREKVLRYLFQKINHVHQHSASSVDIENQIRSCRAFSNAPYTISEAGRLLA